MELSEKAVALLRSNVFEHLALVDERGRLHTTPVWVDVNDQGELIINTAIGRVKDRLLRVGAPVALSATNPDNPYEYLEVQGRVAQRRTEDGDAVIDALAKKYMGLDRYPFRKEGEVRVTVVIEPEHVTGAA